MFSHQHVLHLDLPFYLHFVLPVLLGLLARPLHPGCESFGDCCCSAASCRFWYFIFSFTAAGYLFVSPCNHSSNFETNSWESCWSRPANSTLNFPTDDLKSDGAIDLYCEDQSAFKTCRECEFEDLIFPPLQILQQHIPWFRCTSG